MGTRVAPTYACIFMGDFEETFLSEKWQGTQPSLWKGFINNIFFIWNDSVENLQLFMKELNNHHDYIKFTANYDIGNKSVPFLDMQVSINENGFISTDLYKKDSARVTYLLPSSCHPQHITRNIPYSLAYRLKRICSEPEDFLKRLGELKQDLISRKYHPRIIDEAFSKVKNISRSRALEKVVQTKEQKTPLITTFHPNLPSLTQIVRKHHQVMINESLLNCGPGFVPVHMQDSINLSQTTADLQRYNINFSELI